LPRVQTGFAASESSLIAFSFTATSIASKAYGCFTLWLERLGDGNGWAAPAVLLVISFGKSPGNAAQGGLLISFVRANPMSLIFDVVFCQVNRYQPECQIVDSRNCESQAIVMSALWSPHANRNAAITILRCNTLPLVLEKGYGLAVEATAVKGAILPILLIQTDANISD